MWYALLGTIITIVVALITSLLWKPVDPDTIDPKLLSPFLRKYYGQKEKSIAMQQVFFVLKNCNIILYVSISRKR